MAADDTASGDSRERPERRTPTADRISAAARRYPVTAFLLLSFAWSWGYFAVVVRPLGLVGSLWAQIPFAWGPLIAAALVTDGADGDVREWAGQVTRRASSRWYLLAFLLPFAVSELPRIGAWALGVPVELSATPPREYLTSFLVTLLIAGALEEFGWRGFAQPRLQERHSALSAAVVVGLLWALWHVPFVSLGGATYDPSDIVGLLVMLPLWSIVYAWLYNGSGGALFTAMLFHAAWNTPKPLTLADTASARAEALAGLATIGLWLAIAIAIVAYHGRAYLAADAPDPRIPGRRDR